MKKLFKSDLLQQLWGDTHGAPSTRGRATPTRAPALWRCTRRRSLVTLAVMLAEVWQEGRRLCSPGEGRAGPGLPRWTSGAGAD
jgi:hypothetical protein